MNIETSQANTELMNKMKRQIWNRLKTSIDPTWRTYSDTRFI